MDWTTSCSRSEDLTTTPYPLLIKEGEENAASPDVITGMGRIYR